MSTGSKFDRHLGESGEESPPEEKDRPSKSEKLAVASTAYDEENTKDSAPDRDNRRSSKPEINLLGKTLGGVYKVKDKLGVGGMGVVYLVEHKNLQKEFALKMLGQVAQDHPDAVERFRQEAISASHIEHDNIVDIITLDFTNDGYPYIVMELLKGQSLADAIAIADGMPVEQALPIAYQICRALHAAHEEKIIHRDLKPENVHLTEKGDAEFVKILDFGISKIRDAENKRVRITKTGHILGTPLYMSPEQAKGEPDLDRRVDVYSLGVILFEMLEGKPPFSGENYFQLIWKHSNEPPPEMKADIKQELKDVIERALEKDRDHRYSTMLELEEAIMEAVPEIPPPAFLLDFRPSMVSVTPRPTTESVKPPEKKNWKILFALSSSILIVLGVIMGIVIGSNSNNQRADQADTGHSESSINSPEKQDSSATKQTGSVADAEVEQEPDQQTDQSESAPIVLSIESTPDNVFVYLGGEKAGKTPLVIERSKTSDPVAIKLSKRGYKTITREVLLDKNQTLTFELSRAKQRKNKNIKNIKSGKRDLPGIPIKTDY